MTQPPRGPRLRPSVTVSRTQGIAQPRPREGQTAEGAGKQAKATTNSSGCPVGCTQTRFSVPLALHTSRARAVLAVAGSAAQRLPFLSAAALPFEAGAATGLTSAWLSSDRMTFHTTAHTFAAATVSCGGTKRKLRNWKGTQSFQFATTTLPKSAQAGSRQAVRNAAHATQLRNR